MDLHVWDRCVFLDERIVESRRPGPLFADAGCWFRTMLHATLRLGRRHRNPACCRAHRGPSGMGRCFCEARDDCRLRDRAEHLRVPGLLPSPPLKPEWITEGWGTETRLLIRPIHNMRLSHAPIPARHVAMRDHTGMEGRGSRRYPCEIPADDSAVMCFERILGC
jgi:hypothetical protein